MVIISERASTVRLLECYVISLSASGLLLANFQFFGSLPRQLKKICSPPHFLFLVCFILTPLAHSS